MLCRLSTIRKMSQLAVAKILNNADTAEKRLINLRNELEQIKKMKVEERMRELSNENSILITKIDNAKKELVRLETLSGVKQYSLPDRNALAAATAQCVENIGRVNHEINESAPETSKPSKKEKQKNENKTTSKKANSMTGNEAVIDVSKLDFRIGKIIEINKHPDADSLYVEKIDCGEGNARTVVSGLVNHVPIEEMQNRIVMVLCNLKPVKMRGVTSEAMVMCASSPEKVEVLIPPKGAEPGDLVICEGYSREPETILNPKKKIFETCAPDLKTNEAGVACYKEKPLLVEGKGPVVSASLKGVSVK